MSNSKKKTFVILFTGLIFVLAAYFNLSFIATLCGKEVRSALGGNISFSNLVTIAENTFRGYYEDLMKNKNELTEPARKDVFIEAYGLTQSIFGSDVIYSKNHGQTVFRTNDGRLFLEDLHKGYAYADRVKSLKSFSQWVESKGMDFLLIHAPTKEADADEYPLGMSQEKNVNDCVAEVLNENGVRFIDLRNNPDFSTDSSDWHFKTDHHLTNKSSLLSSQYIVEELNRIYGYGLDENALNTQNFNCELHKKAFLGSTGQKAGSFYAGKDDFEIYLPKAPDTDFYVEITRGETRIEKRKGTFEGAFIFRENLEKSPYLGSMYATYLDADHRLTKIVNNKTDSDKRIVVVKDSYANTIVPYLAMVTKEIVMIDPRRYTESIKEYIEKYNPDTVIIIYNSDAYLEEPFFEFD